MLRKAYLFLIFCLFAFTLHAAPKKIQVFFSFGIYSTQAGMPYVEVYVKIPTSTLNFKPAGDKKYSAAAHAQLYVLRNDTVVFRNKYDLQTMPMADTNANANVLDIKRFELPNGLYDMVLIIEDAEDSLNNAQIDIPIQVSVAKDRIQMADILFCDTLYAAAQPDAFTRYGFNFIPSVSNIMPENRKNLLFYTEIYNTLAVSGKGDFKFAVSVRDAKGALVGLEKIRSQKTNTLNHLFDAVDISRLPGGEYYLRVAVLDKNSKTIAQRDKYFVKYTDSLIAALTAKNTGIQGLSAQQIKDFVPFLEPIASEKDIQNFTKASGKDSTALQMWFYSFWESRDADNPQKAYADYANAVTFVQQNFGTMLSQGFRTDRGRIYLKYGKPDYVAPYVDEPNAYPYEIWHYYKTTTRNNVKFIFYNPTQINNDYILLHSEMPSERQNPNWKRMIYKRIDKSKSVDDNNAPGNFGDDLDKRIRE